jgi:hypothetical protein
MSFPKRYTDGSSDATYSNPGAEPKPQLPLFHFGTKPYDENLDSFKPRRFWENTHFTAYHLRR